MEHIPCAHLCICIIMQLGHIVFLMIFTYTYEAMAVVHMTQNILSCAAKLHAYAIVGTVNGCDYDGQQKFVMLVGCVTLF